MSQLNEFTIPAARPLPVILLADISGSMAENGKITVLNDAVNRMIQTFAQEDDARAEIHVCVVTFGKDGARIHKTLEPASTMLWGNMAAEGKTPMGEAFSITRELIEDRSVIPGRAYRPTIILISDGLPTDDWEMPLKSLLNSERASKAFRFALGIGEDADRQTLNAFLADDKVDVFEAHDAGRIKEFFRFVTMSVTSRSRSMNPNASVEFTPTDIEDIDF